MIENTNFICVITLSENVIARDYITIVSDRRDSNKHDQKLTKFEGFLILVILPIE